MYALPSPMELAPALLAARFAAPTSAGILFSMLEAAGMKDTSPATCGRNIGGRLGYCSVMHVFHCVSALRADWKVSGVETSFSVVFERVRVVSTIRTCLTVATGQHPIF